MRPSDIVSWFPLLVGVLAATPAHAIESADVVDLVAREFGRYGVTASSGSLAEGYSAACRDGWKPACSREWVTAQGPSLAAAAELLEPACAAGDGAACVVVAWHVGDGVRDSVRAEHVTMARRLTAYCARGLHDACHALAEAQLHGRGLRSDHEGALATWDAACRAGHGPSCTTLAQRVAARDGKVPGTRLDYARRGCDAGDPAGCVDQGLVEGATWSRERAEAFWLDQCAAGAGDACVHLVDRIASAGWVTPPGRIEQLLHTGCTVGSGLACGRLGDHRRRVVRDLESAADLYTRACALGAWDACGGLADMVLAGELPRTVLGTRETFELACDRAGHQNACSALGAALMNEARGEEAARARELLERGCTDKDSPAMACAELARFYETGTVADRDRTTASRLYGWACASGDADSCYARGLLLKDGTGVTRDGKRALAMFDAACEGGVAEACKEAGDQYDRGTHVARNQVVARQRFADACEGRVIVACNRLGLLHEEANDHASAFQAYQDGIDLGSVEGKRLQARLLWNGLGTPRKRGLARQRCREACQAGDPAACSGPDYQLSTGLVVGKRDAVLVKAEVVKEEKPPFVTPDLPDGMAWMPRPVCEWQSSPSAEAWMTANETLLRPYVLNAANRLTGVVPPPEPTDGSSGTGDVPTPEPEPEPEPEPDAAEPPIPADRGIVVIGAGPGDRVKVGGKKQALDDDGSAVVLRKGGPVDVEIVGGGREATFNVHVITGYAIWVGVEAPPITRVLFSQGSAVLDEASEAAVAAVADHAGDWTFEVIGSYSPEGNVAKNLELARARAAATRAALINAGVKKDAVIVTEPRPPSPGLSPEQQRAAEVRPTAGGEAP